MTTKHGMLPVVPVQHYRNTESIYGIGIPERFSTIKPYMNNLLKAAVDGAWLNSGNVIFMGNDLTIDGEVYVEPGEVTISHVTGDATKIQPYQTNINIGQITQILQVMEDFGIQATGLNAKSSYTSPASTAFEAGIIKEEQNQRLKIVAKNRNFGLSRAFEMLLSNILQFAPVLYADKIFNGDQIKDFKRYEIQVQNRKLVRNEKEEVVGIEDAIGESDVFNLTTDSLM